VRHSAYECDLNTALLVRRRAKAQKRFCFPGLFEKQFSALVIVRKSDNLSDVKKISSRDFQKRFAEITSTLKNGQVVEITRHGQTVGRFTKTNGKKIKMPDFWAEVQKHGYSTDWGDQLLKEFNESLS
jgi:hypothetical protein